MNLEIQLIKLNSLSNTISKFINKKNANICWSVRCVICEIVHIDYKLIILGNILQI